VRSAWWCGWRWRGPPVTAPEAQALARTFFRDALFADRSVLLISHRFSTVRSADRIYVLREGRVVESGTHSELVALEGTYAELFTLQASPYQKRRARCRARAGGRECQCAKAPFRCLP
jgi:ABC-type multidrug transport system ATPase subunit